MNICVKTTVNSEEKREMIRNELESIFREIFADESLQLLNETGTDDIEEWDSLMQVLLVEEVERTFNFKIDMDNVFQIKTFGDFLQVIENNCNK